MLADAFALKQQRHYRAQLPGCNQAIAESKSAGANYGVTPRGDLRGDNPYTIKERSKEDLLLTQLLESKLLRVFSFFPPAAAAGVQGSMTCEFALNPKP